MAMATANNGQTTAGTGESGKYPAALAMVTVLFFFWGFVTVLNDILVPELKSVFDLNYTRVMLIQFAFFLAYFIFSIPSAKLVGVIGYKKTMVAGLLTMGLGAFLFVPAASALSYPLFLAALMVLAAGITALQVAANPYVAVLGPPETASSRLNLTQAFNSLGTTIGPWVGGLLILGTVVENKDAIAKMSAEALHAFRLQQAASVKFPYIVIGIALVLFAVLIGVFKLPAIPGVEKSAGGSSQVGLWKYRHLILGCVGIFAYVGAEVSIGSFLINYFNQPEIGNLPEVEGAKLVAYYWGGAMVGRFIGSAILQKLKTGIVLGRRRILRLHPRNNLNAYDRPHSCGEHHFRWVLQLHHVSKHLHAWYRQARSPHRRRLRAAHHGHCRRSNHSARSGCHRRSHRSPSCVCASRNLLSLHRLLCAKGLAPCRRKSGSLERHRKEESKVRICR